MCAGGLVSRVGFSCENVLSCMSTLHCTFIQTQNPKRFLQQLYRKVSEGVDPSLTGLAPVLRACVKGTVQEG